MGSKFSPLFLINTSKTKHVSTDTKVKTRSKTSVKVEPPKDYKVIYVNDEVTTMEFVIETLITIFRYDLERARDITELIHTDGSAVVAVLPYELAEQKGVEVTLLARNNGFPLTVKIEPQE